MGKYNQWVYYSVPYEGSNALCVIDFSPTAWSEIDGEGHMRYREVFPGSVIHCMPHDPLNDIKKRHTGIQYHKGEGVGI